MVVQLSYLTNLVCSSIQHIDLHKCNYICLVENPLVYRRVGKGGCVGCDRTPPWAEKVRLEVTCSAENVNLWKKTSKVICHCIQCSFLLSIA